ncbi:MAG: uracil-DNA glycosylase [Alphaproteobacteria bacterium]|nr:uracil-DNA glycosylase [Alphaproteobacteria bacterium]MDE2042410.1 uracil-DNA glycosylase [Alphaproteobacteria bacterium]MDE2340613.1 uracil-DNA glycosylase [Alphaproteobacteria bacterium]
MTVDFPEILSDFMQWLASAPQVPGAGPPSERILPAGDATAALMVLVDMPEAEDIANKRLLSGPAGEMFDRMLAAMQLDRGKIWLAPLNLSRFVQGQNGENNDSARFALIKHHVALVRPQRLWLMGDAPARAILGMNVREASGRLHNFNHIGLNIRTIATLHAQVLHAVPKRKAEVWADMKRLFED